MASGLRVFLVEDSARVRARIIEAAIGDDTVDIVGFAQSETEASLGIQTLRPDAVVLDIQLQNGNGLNILRWLKTLPAESRPLVIVFTDHANPEFRRYAEKHGALYFLDKGLEFSHLQRLLKALGQSHGAAFAEAETVPPFRPGANTPAVPGLRGPFPMSIDSVDNNVRAVSPGVYVLGTGDERGGFAVAFIGRADTNLNGTLKDFVGGKYRQFEFDYAPSAQAAFDRECAHYHDFRPPDNLAHPMRPADSKWKCMRCREFG